MNQSQQISITAKKVIAGNRPVALKMVSSSLILANATWLLQLLQQQTKQMEASVIWRFESFKGPVPTTMSSENTETKVQVTFTRITLK